MNLKTTDLHWSVWLLAPVVIFIAVCAYAAISPQGYFELFESTSKDLEFSVVLIPFIAIILAIHLLTFSVVRSDLRLFFWILLLILGAILLAGEDVGWGRDIIDLSYPQWWPPYGGAGTDALREIVRALLKALAVIFGIGLPLIYWMYPPLTGNITFFRLVWPTFVGVPVLIFSVLSFLPRGIMESKIDLSEGDELQHNEVGEMFVYLFLLLYVLSLYHRLRQIQKKI